MERCIPAIGPKINVSETVNQEAVGRMLGRPSSPRRGIHLHRRSEGEMKKYPVVAGSESASLRLAGIGSLGCG